ncbi:MFS general substrate transporter [Aspergillus uvarum CBS 121591]|uniref:MFS general substrate transporter n=1 Tax=Aspergillus uvarum CBS 121591 TaxID=1448315 RepID=A0A319C2F4_9EURO|nr:MFS general substrate transporter [Aspergillus uvarum CBS 121591]PYH79284.1 MFS general substrate transporter [Aspergillus uvarum CBS 121591]
MEGPSTQDPDHDQDSWPPGTVWLQELYTNHDEIILQPRPSSDPNDPLNWASYRKYLNFGLTCLWALLINEFLCAATPTWSPMHVELGFSWAILNDSYAAGCGTMAIGAVFLTPLALKFGRRSLYILSALVTFAVSIWSAKMHKTVELMMVNVLSCFFGALSEVIVQMTIADIFYVHQRGLMNAIFIWTVQVGGSLGPLAAGYITVSQGWRWVWWWNAILFGACLVLLGFFYEESKFVTVIDEVVVGDEQRPPNSRKFDENNLILATQTMNPDQTHLKLDTPPTINPNIPLKPYWQRLTLFTSSPGDWKIFARHVYQPFIIMGTFPGVTFVALTYGVMVALQNSISTTMSSRMTQPPYNFSASAIGLMNLPQFVGVTLASLVVGGMSDAWILRLSHRNRGIYEPEFRLWVIVPFLPLILAGALMFGYGIERGLAWPIVAVGIALASAGIASINTVVLTYITDSYTDIVGDALVGVTFIRNSVSTVFIFSLSPWGSAVGIQNVILSMACIATFVLSFIAVFIIWGKKLRAWTTASYEKYSLRQAHV